MQGHFLPSSLVGDATGVAIGRSSLTPCLSGTSIMAVGYMLDEVLMCGSRCIGGVTGCVRTRRGICIGFGFRHVHVGIDMFTLYRRLSVFELGPRCAGIVLCTGAQVGGDMS